MYINHPLFGVGVGMFKKFLETYQHNGLSPSTAPEFDSVANNIYLTIAATTGTIGLAILLQITFLIGKMCIKLRFSIAKIITSTFFFVFFFSSLYNDTFGFFTGPYFAIMVGILIYYYYSADSTMRGIQ